MAFLLKVFSGSDRLKEKQKSAVVVHETFRTELNDVQSKLEVENYELQMLVEMLYDSSYPESQKFLKQPTTDRLYAHKETISSLLFGLAAQGVSVAPLILTHFQKFGCDAIADTLLNLLELVRPLLASKDMPEHTSDDILDAIDNQWHSSVRSSPAFCSLRGSRPPSPLHSPRVSFSNISPRQSPFSTERNLRSSPGQIPPYGLSSPRKTQPFSFSPPSSLPDSGLEGARTAPPRRSLSSHYFASDVDLSGERLQPLAEHDEETNTGKFREPDSGSAELLADNEAVSRKESSSYEADENNALLRNKPQSFSTSAGADGGDYAAEENFKDVSTAGHNTLLPVLPYSLNTGEYSKALSINIPRSSKCFEVKELNGGESAGRSAQVTDDRGNHNDDAGVNKVNGTIVGFLPLGHVRSRSISFDKPRLEFSHGQSDKSVRDVNIVDPSEGSSARVGRNEDTAEKILESDVPFHDSISSSNFERQIPVKEIVASLSSLPTNHVEDSEQGILETNGQELNSTDDSFTSEKRVEEDCLHLSEDMVDVVKMVDVPTPHVAIKTQLRTADDKRDECDDVQEAMMFNDSSMPAFNHENVTETLTDSSSAKEVKDGSLDVPVFSSLVEGCEHDVQKEIASARDSDSECKIMVGSSFQGANSEDSPLHRASSPNYTQTGELGSRSWLEKSTSIQSEGFEYAGDAKGLGNDIQNEVDKAEEDMEKFSPEETNNEGRDGVVDGVEEDIGVVNGVVGDKAVDGVVGDGDKVGKSSSMLIPVVEDDNSLVSATTVNDKEESHSSSVGPNEEYLAEKLDVEAEVEVQEPPQLRDIVEIGTDVLSQSSFSDHYDDGGDDESTSSSGDESPRSTSSEKRRSPTSSDDETDHQSSLPSNGTEETTAPLPVSVFDEDWHLCHVENGEHLAGNDSSGLLSSIDGDENKAQEAERTGLDEHVSNPDLDLPQGAELHSPSYNSVIYDLTKLSRDDNEDTSSCSSLQSKDGAVPNVTSKSVSCDDLDMTFANCFTGKELASPSSSTASSNTVATGASLLSLSSQYKDGLVDDITLELVLSSKIDEFQNSCSSVNTDAGVSTDLELDSQVVKGSLTEQKDQDAEGAGVVHSVALHSENETEEADWNHLPETEINELKNPNHSDHNLHVSNVEGETAPASQNVWEANLRMKGCEPQSPQQLPADGSNQQVACVNDPLVSLSSDVVIHSFLLGNTVEDRLLSKDLVQNGSVIPCSVTVQEANDAELLVREPSSGHAIEPILVGAMDFQTAHNDSEAHCSSKALINGFGDSPAMENSCRVAGHNEVDTSSDNHSQGAQDEEEQDSPKPDSEDSKSEDHLHHAEAEEREVPTFASLEAKVSADAGGELYALKGLGGRGEQYEANGSIHQAIENGYGAIAESVNYSVEDPSDFEVSRDTDEEAASPTEQDDEGVLNDQYGLNSANSKAEGDEIGAAEHVSNQLISTEYEGEPPYTNGNYIKEHAIPGTSSHNLSSTVDEEDRNSLTDEDEGHDGVKWKKLEGGIPSNSVQFVEEIDVNDYGMSEAEHVTVAIPLPAQGGEVSVLRVNPSELALFESQSKENAVQENVLQFPERDDLLLAEEKRAGELPSNTCDGNMISHVGHDHDEDKSDKETDLVVHLDEVILSSQAEELKDQDSKQVLDGVYFRSTTESLCSTVEVNDTLGVYGPTTNLRTDESETSGPSEYEDGKETQATSELPKLVADCYESSGSKSGHTLEHTYELFGMVPAAPEESHSVKGMSPQFLANSAFKEKDAELPRKGTLLKESRVALFKSEEVGEGEVSTGVQTAQLSDALTYEEVDEWEINNKNEGQQLEKGSDTFVSIEEPAMEGTKEPILHTLEKGMELDEKENHMGFINEPMTYGVFLHNTTFLNSQDNFVKAQTAPVNMARSTEVLQCGPDRHSIRDSIICTTASFAGSSRTHKSIQQIRRRYNLFRTLCCTCFKSSAL